MPRFELPSSVRASLMSQVTPIVFIVDDDISVRESLSRLQSR